MSLFDAKQERGCPRSRFWDLGNLDIQLFFFIWSAQ
jgi:hypothetical protein